MYFIVASIIFSKYDSIWFFRHFRIFRFCDFWRWKRTFRLFVTTSRHGTLGHGTMYLWTIVITSRDLGHWNFIWIYATSWILKHWARHFRTFWVFPRFIWTFFICFWAGILHGFWAFGYWASTIQHLGTFECATTHGCRGTMSRTSGHFEHRTSGHWASVNWDNVP